MDGNELTGTIAQGKKHALIGMVNVWVEEYSLSFGQLAVEQKRNEMTAIPALPETIDCPSGLITKSAYCRFFKWFFYPPQKR